MRFNDLVHTPILLDHFLVVASALEVILVEIESLRHAFEKFEGSPAIAFFKLMQILVQKLGIYFIFFGTPSLV